MATVIFCRTSKPRYIRRNQKCCKELECMGNPPTTQNLKVKNTSGSKLRNVVLVNVSQIGENLLLWNAEIIQSLHAFGRDVFC